ncbi:MAG: Aldo/keto reductase family enzyme ARA1 [Candidatus Methanohalarchaeum thermophilum]|uniref:Aldo/keto reductase family enzyme ARA1 n=1 Tax=Methanohalarchaeum thermophilum TaxID=1903181 RepID=A0A1Q6DW30_METT1|nr:MAG: Aldo/keto reductase family enzyme ARA1 [Candidatus Methanohalarchaeum thermophilum]
MDYEVIRGTKIPKIGFGTWKIRGEKCTESVKDALDIGYRHIDTAQFYKNEEEVGKAIKKSSIDRKEIFLTTKVWRTNLSYKKVKETTNRSLDKLKTNYVDLLLIHWPNKSIPIEETMNAFIELVNEGKVKNIGVSNYTAELLEKLVKECKYPIFCDQVEFHPYNSQEKLLNFCQKEDILLTAYSPLARGDVGESNLLKEIGKKYDKTPYQISLRFLIQHEKVVALPKAEKREHRLSNIDIFDFELSESEMDKIKTLDKGKRKVSPSFSPWK